MSPAEYKWTEMARGKALRCQVGDHVYCQFWNSHEVTRHVIRRRIERADCESRVAFVVDPPVGAISEHEGVDSGWFIPASPTPAGEFAVCALDPSEMMKTLGVNQDVLKRRIEELEAALAPFARCGKVIKESHGGETPTMWYSARLRAEVFLKAFEVYQDMPPPSVAVVHPTYDAYVASEAAAGREPMDLEMWVTTYGQGEMVTRYGRGC
jgi:hypothetical protein